MTKHFDAFIAVDWSAKNVPSSAKPTADALWVGIKNVGRKIQEERYFRTRDDCCRFLQQYLAESTREGQRVIVGYDFDFGFPNGLAKAMGYGGSRPWRFLWDFIGQNISDAADNRNNRFEVAAAINKAAGGIEIGPLWGCPAGVVIERLEPKSPQYPFQAANGVLLNKKRWCEAREARAQPVWKLIGTASVGGQSLVGIPRLNALRSLPELSHISKIWPFETGFDNSVLGDFATRILHVEIWPGLLSKRLDQNIPIRDQAQVRATVNWLSEIDALGQLKWLMTPPKWLEPEQIEAAIGEEGWVIGAGLDGQLFEHEAEHLAPSQGVLF